MRFRLKRDSMTTLASPLYAAARFLNQPPYKDRIKDVVTWVAFGAGLWQFHRTVCWLRDGAPIHIKNLHSAIMLHIKTSLLLGGIASRPGIILCGRVAHWVFTDAQLMRYFGPNTIFERNPSHPRHVVSLAAAALGAEAIALLFISKLPPVDKRICYVAAALTLVSRPVLHLANNWTR